MSTELKLLDKDQQVLAKIPLKLDHWEACELGNHLLLSGLVNADDFDVEELEES